MSYDFDAIIIGSGAGGSIVAHALTQAGKKVLLVERGDRYPYTNLQQLRQNRMRAFDDRTIEVNGKKARLYISGILGGGISLYGAVLMRPSRLDFHPGKYYSPWLPRHLWDWPITYEDLAPYYDRVEQLLQVAGDEPSKMPHVETPIDRYPRPVPPLEPINQKLARAITQVGFTPFHVPTGINFDRCLRCSKCSGYYCPNGSRVSLLEPIVDRLLKPNSLTIKTLTEADCLLGDSKGKVTGVRLRCRNSDRVEELTAKVYILSAGALGSSVILLKSGLSDRSGQVGRNYMYHCGALAAGIFIKPTGGADKFIKQLGFSDLYFGKSKFPHKMGFAQTISVPDLTSLQTNFPLPISYSTAEFINARIVILTGLVEDLPLPENRLELSKNGTISLRHKFHYYDVYRSHYYLHHLKKVLTRAGAVIVLGDSGEKDDLYTSHQVGTTRFGTDPQISVLDPDCRLHNYDNVFVVDGGFMPTSLGVSPALTIMANALRVAETIKQVC